MNSFKLFLSLITTALVFIACYKDDITGPAPTGTVLSPIVYTLPWPAGTGAISTKPLKIKLLDNETNRGVKDAVYYIKAIGRKLNCTGITGCDSLLYEDSVVTDAEGNAVLSRRGSEESLRPVKGYWELSQLKQSYSFANHDSVVFKLWPEVWVKLEIKNVSQYDNNYVFSPRLECPGMNAVYQPIVGVNKDTTITERLWANQNYKITLNLYRKQFGTLNGSPEQVLSQFNQFIGKDTTKIVLSY